MNETEKLFAWLVQLGYADGMVMSTKGLVDAINYYEQEAFRVKAKLQGMQQALKEKK